MKLGASATSPGVTARWHADHVCVALFVAREFAGHVWPKDGAWKAWSVYLNGGRWVTYRHRYQAKRAVEAAVSQALREAGE